MSLLRHAVVHSLGVGYMPSRAMPVGQILPVGHRGAWPGGHTPLPHWAGFTCGSQATRRWAFCPKCNFYEQLDEPLGRRLHVHFRLIIALPVGHHIAFASRAPHYYRVFMSRSLRHLRARLTRHLTCASFAKASIGRLTCRWACVFSVLVCIC